MQQNGSIFGTLRFLISFFSTKMQNNSRKLQSTLWFSLIAFLAVIKAIQYIADLILSDHSDIGAMCYKFSELGSFIKILISEMMMKL